MLLVTESDRPGTAPTKYLQPEMVRVRPLPLYRDVLFQVRNAAALAPRTDITAAWPYKKFVPLCAAVLVVQVRTTLRL